MKKHIALVGENPNDVNSIVELLKQKFVGKTYCHLIKNVPGAHLDTEKAKRVLHFEVSSGSHDVLIFIRDADGIWTNETKKTAQKDWYSRMSSGIKCKNMFLLNVYELEALIFADISAFNECYGVSLKGGRDVTYIHDPKKELKQKTEKAKRKFHENDCPEIFSKMNIDTVMNNCAYFKEFVDNLGKHIGN